MADPQVQADEAEPQDKAAGTQSMNSQRLAILFFLPVPGSISGFLVVLGRPFLMLGLSRGPMGFSALFMVSLYNLD